MKKNAFLIAVVVAGVFYAVFYPPAREAVFLGHRSWKIPTGSMEPTVHVGERAYSESIREVHRGDVIVYRSTLDPKEMFLKRVVALPGETIEIRAKKVFIDGRALDEPYAHFEDPQIIPLDPALPEPYRSRDHFGPLKVGTDAYFVLGDNRDRSADSRYWGTVPRAAIVGRLVRAGPLLGPLRDIR